ncbi:MAG TPA: aldehyde dehydrogenase family protein [Flavobacteriales bacterium]|nr:aldehyde dehydrogenase family protein [Flavobacteriales bacterium]
MSKTLSKTAKALDKINGNGHLDGRKPAATAAKDRIPVMKTYKLYIGGKFPRTESGRYYQPKDADGKPLANVCRSSRKDLRESVVAARKAFGDWGRRTAYNRGQILYRIGEMLEGRSAQFVHELMLHGATRSAAEKEVTTAIDRWIHYAGWCDKYQALFSSVNPTATSHFNFSVQEPTGVVGILAPEESGLLGLVDMIAPAITGGNTVVVVASESKPLPAISFTEVLATSDLPGGVVNLLTGFRSELIKPMVGHMDVNAIVCANASAEERKLLDTEAATNMKRIIHRTVTAGSKGAGATVSPNGAEDQSPYFILDTQEVKTTWHPIERGQGGGGGY